MGLQLAGQNETCTSMMTVPPDYLDAGNTMPVGIVLGHGMEADDWRGEFLTRIAVHFAKKGADARFFFVPLRSSATAGKKEQGSLRERQGPAHPAAAPQAREAALLQRPHPV